MYKWFAFITAAALLTGCSSDQHASTEQPDTILQEKAVSFELAGDEVKEAASLPTKEKRDLLAAFDEYIAAFNEGDLERYMAMISKNPQGFDYDDDEEAAKEVFATYDVNRQAVDVTVIDYESEAAQVFANLTIDMKERATGVSLSSSGRQVTVFVKEDGEWKVTSVYFIGNETSHVSHIQ
ncbi:nuclear transport factor 2 family protein [Caryophanon latum]|uniref:DUF4440 domain-containing protein n=1 Tax=Caryophanon latum TaxID=33977 RepID=A0A1C0YI58_9BACL|nr:nuclear transport factor 2 family protein [Caryophanon latum]OCS86814.1 hypothetical protein A6K76_14280 [Caryophanon latum]